MSDLNHLMDHAADDWGGWNRYILLHAKQAALAYLAGPEADNITTDFYSPATIRITVTLTPDQIQAAIDEGDRQ